MKQYLILVLLLCSVCCSAKNLTHYDDFDRMSVSLDDGREGGERKQRVPLCKPSHIKNGTADACIMAAIPRRLAYNIICESGRPHPHTFYTDTLDTLSLSALIYEITKLRATAKESNSDLYDSLQAPLRLSDAHNISEENINLIEKDCGKEVLEASKFMEAFNTNDDLICVRDEVKGVNNERNITKFGDSEADVSESRVHIVVVDHHKKRVDVVFRGTQRAGDWWTNLNAVWRRRVANPVQFHQKKTSHIHLHRGFAKALLGDATSPDLPTANDIACNNKASGNNEESAPPIKKILCEVKAHVKKGYRLYVTGHSLGGATATLFAFFAASTDPDITSAGPVNLFTYASPRVGGRTFQDAFKFLEERGQIRHARFRNQKDKVPMNPYLLGKYNHVGVEIRLRKDEIPIIDYPTSHTWTQSGLNVVENVVSTARILHYHSTEVMLQRIVANTMAFNNTSLQQEYQMIWGI
ncbi:hypothetical protein ACHAXR_004168 [Thalassiosira sp. AJA248-18]